MPLGPASLSSSDSCADIRAGLHLELQNRLLKGIAFVRVDGARWCTSVIAKHRCKGTYSLTVDLRLRGSCPGRS